MAPPRRRTKKGDRRVDAALDAMRQYGFDQKIVHRTIRELLKVYDGEWSFMEEFAYKLLIDSIIDKQEIEAQPQSEITNGAETSASRELVASDLPDPWNSVPLSGKSPLMAVQNGTGPLDKPPLQVELHQYPRRNRKSQYAKRVRNILGGKRSCNYSKDSPCNRRFFFGYLGDDKQDELIDVEPQSAASAGVPVALLLSRGRAYYASQKVTNADRI